MLNGFGMEETIETKIVSLAHGDAYSWKKGVCLRALQDVELVFPGFLVEPSEEFGCIIEVSDPKTEIGLVSKKIGQGLETINIRLKKNCSLRLHKNTETVITFDSTSPSAFRIESS